MYLKFDKRNEDNVFDPNTNEILHYRISKNRNKKKCNKDFLFTNVIFAEAAKINRKWVWCTVGPLLCCKPCSLSGFQKEEVSLVIPVLANAFQLQGSQRQCDFCSSWQSLALPCTHTYTHTLTYTHTQHTYTHTLTHTPQQATPSWKAFELHIQAYLLHLLKCIHIYLPSRPDSTYNVPNRKPESLAYARSSLCTGKIFRECSFQSDTNHCYQPMGD